MKSKPKNKALIVILFFMVWIGFLIMFPPESIVEYLGIENAYLLLFVSAFLGGSSILIPFPYYLLAISFGAAGLNPFLIGLVCGCGTLLGDTISYTVASRSRYLFSQRWICKFNQGLKWAETKHRFVVPVLSYFYASLFPLSDDIVVVPAGIIKYPFWKLAIGLFPGKVTYNTLLALAGYYGLNLFI